MPSDPIATDLTSLIQSAHVVTYAKAMGWIEARTKRDNVAVFERPRQEQRFDQLIIPANQSFDDYAVRMADVVVRLAKFQERTAAQVLTELLAPPSDILRFRVDDPIARDGTVPFEEGFNLIKGIRRSLQSVACSVLEANTFHPRLSRSESELLVHETKMGQTERGSFIALIILPLNAVPEDVDYVRQMTLFPDDSRVPFVRKTTTHLMQAVSHIALSLERGQPEQIDMPTERGVQVSANLCDALLEMRPPSESSILQIMASWSPAVPSPEATPSTVEIRREWYPEIERCAARLRPHQEPEKNRFVAKVVTLMGKADEQGKMSGDVTLLFQHEDELLRTKINLTPRDYQIACDAHKADSYITVEGVLIRRARVHQIDPYSNFNHLFV